MIKGQMRFPRFRRAAIQIAIFALAAVLNLYQIGRTSLWNDEGFSFLVTQREPAHALKFIADDTQLPLYCLTLSLWLGLGAGVFVIRTLPPRR